MSLGTRMQLRVKYPVGIRNNPLVSVETWTTLVGGGRTK